MLKLNKKAARLLRDVIDGYKDGRRNDELIEMILSIMQEKKGFLYIREIEELCREINSEAWNTAFYFDVYYLGTHNKYGVKPETKILFYGGGAETRFFTVYSRNSGEYWTGEDVSKRLFIGTERCQFLVSIMVDVIDDFGVGEYRGLHEWGKNLPIVTTIPELLNPQVKEHIKTVWNLKDVLDCVDGTGTIRYYKNGEEIFEPGGASLVADYSVERRPNSFFPFLNVYLGKKK